MAQALYQPDHPLREYLRNNGETRTIPGGLDDFPELDEHELNEDASLTALMTSFLTAGISLSWQQMFAEAGTLFVPPNREFAERFKYIVISSALLSTSIATPGPSRPPDDDPPPPDDAADPPGTWHDSAAGDEPSFSSSSIGWVIPLIALVTVKSPSTQLLIAGGSWLLRTRYRPPERKPAPQLKSALDSLESLVRTSNACDSIVGKVMSTLEEEDEPQCVHLAIEELLLALQTVCDTMHMQTVNIRHLFSPLTAPLELSMLSEMYAPSSLSRSQSVLVGHKRDGSAASPSRPLPSHSTSLPKRASWNGPNSRRAPIQPLSSSEAYDSVPMTSTSAAHSPPSPSLDLFSTEVGEPFGSVALNMQRKRRKIMPMAPAVRPSGEPSAPNTEFRPDALNRLQSHRSPLTTPSSPSAGVYSERPLRRIRSLSSLRSSLQNAVDSRRYAASHLLALRFEEDAHDPYWEDVVSVINLLTTSLQESATTLSKAWNEYLESRRLDQVPTPPRVPSSAPSDPHRLGSILSFPMRPSSELASFAPMPTQLSKFAAHMDAMSHALECAGEELRVCLAALQSPPPAMEAGDQEGRQGTSGSDALRDSVLESYGRLRLGLGAAIRECERGREPLFASLGVESREDDEENSEDSELRDVPHTPPPGTNGHHASSSEGLENSPTFSRSSVVFTPELETNENVRHVEVFDDIGSHLRDISNPFHLPANPPEQVFEAAVEEDVPLFSRERSKLSREERIRLANERRTTTGSKGVLPSSSKADENTGVKGGHDEAWGPGGDVVQELKSVINLVGEKRRTPSTGSTKSILPSLRERPPPPNACRHFHHKHRRLGHYQLRRPPPRAFLYYHPNPYLQ
ncbi:hypothetical protein BS47DRAFT_1394013 [Hydnum rufescens UP504]|uniref:Uncharacterized protein n=1 Tax=Hydnum rufescens UP504 TaxID=1448309 RepID=A0A9P6AWK9_9AGAM|nr:hypothetical protein BS47DRAFT_1394013 [Hydnum rufescens UP504]